MSSSAVAVTCLVVPGSSFENGLFFSGAVKCYSEIPKTTIIHGMVLDGIEPSRNWTGHFFDGIEISRDCTGLDWDTTGLLGTEFRYHGIARDGLYILWDCTGRHAENDFTRYLYGTQEAHCFLLYYKEINIHWYNVPLHLAYSSHLRAAALTTVVLTKRNDYTSLSRWQRLPSKLKLKMFMKISFY